MIRLTIVDAGQLSALARRGHTTIHEVDRVGRTRVRDGVASDARSGMRTMTKGVLALYWHTEAGSSSDMGIL
ncbi:hypothetical protein HZH68_002845 [Vespula germanica]|uniref:Uncharacterized protein n=1 Tax=Vespula germanica TaxID=30212 RepID=A0A834U1R7_VESGE|nr:hypothetical protein HZH68_002845 [Vespula germanica]